jgi:hypothetical protein
MHSPWLIADVLRPTSAPRLQFAMTLDCRHLIPVFVFIFRLLKFTVEGTISCHSSAVSFSESTDRLTDGDNSSPAAYRAASSIPRFYTMVDEAMP